MDSREVVIEVDGVRPEGEEGTVDVDVAALVAEVESLVFVVVRRS